MIPFDDPEEVAALAVLDTLGRLDSPEDTSVPEPENEIDGFLRRLYTDAVALVAYSLEPAPPPARLRAAVFSLTVGETTQEVESDAATPDGAAAVAPPAPPSGEALRPAAVATAERPAAGPGSAPAGRAGRGWLALAALFALALVGAGVWIGYLQSELAAQGARLAWAEREGKGRADAAERELRQLEQKLELVTSPAVTVFHLRCPGGSGPGATANANVYVSADRKRWDLDVKGLTPQPPGRDYQLWFLVGDETRSGGCFTVEDGEIVLLNPASFPPGTTGVAISVEPKGGSQRPTTPPILVSEEPVRL